MQCKNCHNFQSNNDWKCTKCGASINGGVVFVTGISGSGTEEHLRKVADLARNNKHNHSLKIFDVGEMMRHLAFDDDPDVNWDKILDSDERALRNLRVTVLRDLAYSVNHNPEMLHIVDLHLSFRWYSYLTRGFEPRFIDTLKPHIRCFINLIEDLSTVQDRLKSTSWGERNILELMIWRDEELFLTDLYADICGRVKSYVVSTNEPPSVVEQLIWHPNMKKVYLSFPITNILDDKEANNEIVAFRDAIREFLTVFDPYACKDYDETYKRPEMSSLRDKVGQTTVDRDFRFIDQSDAIVVYFPKKVASKGVDAEMNHARRVGKPIYLYSPEHLGGGPFAVPPKHYKSDQREFIGLLRNELSDA